MRHLRHEGLRRPAADPPFLVLAAALVLCLVRSVNQPSVDIHAAGTVVSVVPADIALAVLGLLCVQRLLGAGSLPKPARATTAAATAFSAWLLISSAAHGSAAIVGAAKVLEYGLLGLGCVLFVRRRAQLWALLGVVVLVTVAADLWAIPGFVHGRHAWRRQGSFLGQHDFAALATLSLSVGLAGLFARSRERRALLITAGVAGAVGVALGAAFASVIGLYLAIIVLVVLAWVRGDFAWRPVLATLVLAGALTGAVAQLRQGELGFVNAAAGQQEAAKGQYAASWSQRLLLSYIGGRVFLDHPVLGVGWYGELPPKVWARYLPDAHRRFSDQPARYFPPASSDLIPQQTYDQILYELGIVGGVLFLALGLLTIRTATRVGLDWPADDPDEALAYVAGTWTAALAGSLAGAALFGGIPLTAIFWLTLGVVAIAPTLVPVRAAPAPRRAERELATAAS